MVMRRVSLLFPLFRAVPRLTKRTVTSIEDGYKVKPSDPSKMMLRTALQFSILNRHGGLLSALRILEKHSINIIQLKSREAREGESKITMYCDIEGHTEEPHVAQAINELQASTAFLTVVSSHKIPWFPRCLEDLDLFDMHCLAGGGELPNDPENPHPGFNDEVYKSRRLAISQIARSYKIGEPIPTIEYSASEISTWTTVYHSILELFSTHTCRQYQYIFPLLVENAGFGPNNIPQLEDVSRFLHKRTGWTLKPVTGLLSPRDFLNGLALRVFHSTQYIRHHSRPLYTPEPDICHELLGHVPLLADPQFADFSQQLGLASLGASDEDISRLATVYWFTVEFGLLKQQGKIRAYGAGLLSSFGELKYSLSDSLMEGSSTVRQLRPFTPSAAADTQYPITTYQPLYFVADSFPQMKQQMIEFSHEMDRPFRVEYNAQSQTVNPIHTNTEKYMRGEW